MNEPTLHGISKEQARLGERMNAHHAKYEGALDRFRADMEKFRADMAQRESNRMQWLIGLWIGGLLLTIAVLGIFIRLSI